MSLKDAAFNEFLAEMRALDPNFAPRKIVNKLRAAFVAGSKRGAMQVIEASVGSETDQEPCQHNWKRAFSDDSLHAGYTCTKCGADS